VNSYATSGLSSYELDIGLIMKLAAFDIETAKEFPDNVDDWRKFGPLGIACAAISYSDSEKPSIRHGAPQMTQEKCQILVKELQDLTGRGYKIVTWNGCGFDFALLAEESGMLAECADLAMNHIDMMLIVTFTKGWFLGLQKALEGAGLGGKVKSLTLSDGTIIKNMDGAKAPGLWAQGEQEAVLTYLQGDVVQLLKLAEAIQQKGDISWISGRGKRQKVNVNSLLTVRECFDIPEPDVSWMNDPPTRRQFVEWMKQD